MSPDQPKFPPPTETSSVPGVGKVIARIREEYRGVPYGSPRAKAFIDITTLVGLYVHGGGVGKDLAEIDRALIFRKGKDSEEYKVASERLDGLTASCLGKGKNLLATATALDNQLHTLVAELYPQHAQEVAVKS